ncbi:TetR/AcrR family transcriptional regulator [Rhizorhabdus argentea]|uniref:TetR/AcrR family transcriptional regulator n=1 Tax=Rhizorhabdus argentea TaxID=1387174 RepID=UPI0030EDB56F
MDAAVCADLESVEEAEQVVPAKRGRRKKSDLKQRAILEAAAKVFKSKGYARATLSEIGKKAGTFAGSMYYHFASKEELVEEVLNQGTTRVAEVVAEAVAALPDGSSHRAKIKAAFRAHLNQMLLRDDFIVAYWRIIDQVPTSVRARHLKKPRDYGDFWRTLIAEAANAGEIRSDVQKTILRLVLVGSSIYALDWYSPRGEMDPDDIADAVIDILFDGVAPANRRESD